MTKYGIFVGGELVSKHDTMTEAVIEGYGLGVFCDIQAVLDDAPITTDQDIIAVSKRRQEKRESA